MDRSTVNAKDYVKWHKPYFVNLMAQPTITTTLGGVSRRFVIEDIPHNLLETFINFTIWHIAATNCSSEPIEALMVMSTIDYTLTSSRFRNYMRRGTNLDRVGGDPSVIEAHLARCYENVKKEPETLKVLHDIFDLAIAIRVVRGESHLIDLIRNVTLVDDDFVSLIKQCTSWWTVDSASPSVYLNPVLICRKRQVQGDVDLLVDDTLIDFKYTIRDAEPNDFAKMIVCSASAYENGIEINKMQIFNPLTGDIFEMEYDPFDPSEVWDRG